MVLTVAYALAFYLLATTTQYLLRVSRLPDCQRAPIHPRRWIGLAAGQGAAPSFRTATPRTRRRRTGDRRRRHGRVRSRPRRPVRHGSLAVRASGGTDPGGKPAQGHLVKRAAPTSPRSRSSGPRASDIDPGGFSKEDLRKEVIQPQVPLRLPCYDLVPITGFTFGACLAAPATSDAPRFGGLTGGVYKAQEHIHRGMLIRDY
jgi:hypothetical protein